MVRTWWNMPWLWRWLHLARLPRWEHSPTTSARPSPMSEPCSPPPHRPDQSLTRMPRLRVNAAGHVSFGLLLRSGSVHDEGNNIRGRALRPRIDDLQNRPARVRGVG